jgi:phosphoserine phosphatase RsbU/P
MSGEAAAIRGGFAVFQMRIRSKLMFRSRLFRSLAVAVSLIAAPAWASIASPHPPLNPHHVDGSMLGGPIDLSSTWLVQQGDEPRFADPSLDDSYWTVVQAGKKLSGYGIKDVNHVWYRTHVQIPPGQQNLSVLIRYFAGSFEIFVNGIEVGSSGPHPSGGVLNGSFDQRFPIPDAAVRSGDVTIAVRASIGRASLRGAQEGGFATNTTLLLGSAPLLFDTTLLYKLRSYGSNIANIVMELLVPLIALALAVTLPKERVYIALVIAGAALFVTDTMSVWHALANSSPGDVWFFADACLQVAGVIASLEFVRLALDLRRTRLWAAYEWMIGIVLIVSVPWLNHAFVLGANGPTNSVLVVINLFAGVLLLPVSTGLPALALWVWWRRRNPDALLLSVPLFFQAVVGYCNLALAVLSRLHLTELSSLPAVPTKIFFMQWSEVAAFLFNVALLLFLVLRTVRIARSRAAMASDLEAVHSVQEILLARASHDTPGFQVEHVYHPAQEVGGDFFLVSPGPDGSLTAIVGDVSGKGLVAAMRVSMILGVLRREEHREPDTILQNLNEALLLQGEMGFTTACCVRLERDGRYTVANAGHISPYIGGEEIVSPPSLPLGIEEHQVYEQVSGVLTGGQTLVLMSDGVVEARSVKGELYGFERLAKLTLKSAHDIADAALSFGQEDDITVLTVACGA